MKIFLKLKIGDFIIALLLLAVSFLPFLMLHPRKTNTSHTHLTAVVEVNNHKVKSFNLNHNTRWIYHHNNEMNAVEVKNKRIRVYEANCKDQICVKQGWKSQAGQTIVCLPHKFLIQIENSKSQKKTSKKDFDHTLVKP